MEIRREIKIPPKIQTVKKTQEKIDVLIFVPKLTIFSGKISQKFRFFHENSKIS